MIKLTIKNSDGSIYWTEHFHSQEECDKWLNSEKTRPYWKKEFSTVIDEIVEIKPTPEEIEAERLKREKKQKSHSDRITSLKSIDLKKNLTAAQVETIVKLLVEDFLKDEE